MADEIALNGMKIAPSVLDTIVTMAVQGVEGVASSSSGQGFGGLMNRASGRAVEFSLTDDGEIAVCVHLRALYPTPLMDLGVRVRVAVSDAIRTQVGAEVAWVDVYVDGIEFPA